MLMDSSYVICWMSPCVNLEVYISRIIPKKILISESEICVGAIACFTKVVKPKILVSAIQTYKILSLICLVNCFKVKYCIYLAIRQGFPLSKMTTYN